MSLSSRTRRIASRSALSLAIIPTTVFASSFAPATAADGDVVDLNVLAVTDFHGHISVAKQGDQVTEPGAAALACFVNKERQANPNTTFVSAGDNIGGSPFVSSILKDKPTLQALNEMKLEVSAVGNHEFDKGYDDLKNRVGIDGTKEAKFPYLGANVEGSDLGATHVQDINGVKVGFVGTVTETTPSLVAADGTAGLKFTDPVKKANEEAAKLKSEGKADVVVGLVHEGVTSEGFSSDVDAVVAGHTHQEQSAEGHPAVVQPGEYGKLLGDLDISYNKATHKVESVKPSNHTAKEIWDSCGETPDPQVAKIVTAAEEASKIEGEKVVAHTDSEFSRGTNGEGTDTGSNRGTESSLNSLLGDVALYGANKMASMNADIGVMNPGGVRADLPAGDVTFGQAYAVQPFGNSLGVAEITGEQLKQVLEEQWRQGEREMLALGFSDNVQYSYDPHAEQGKRINHITINGEPVDPAKHYRVAGNTFLLNEGDDFTGFGTKTGSNKTEDSGIMDVDAFNAYLNSVKDLKPRGNQTSVGVHIDGAQDGKLVPGSTIKVKLSSLSYTCLLYTSPSPRD